MENILIINTFGIGDVLFSTPLVANLRRAYPQAHIVYMANRRTAGFLCHNPKIDEVIVYERDEFVAVYKRNPLAFVGQWVHLGARIRQTRFDAVFDLSQNSTFGFVCKMAGIPKRIGYDYRRRGRSLTHKIPLVGYEGRHVAEYYLDLLTLVGIKPVVLPMEMPIPSQDEQWAKDWVKQQGIDPQKPLVGVVPGGGQSWGTNAKNKRWPSAKYADLVHKVVAEKGAAVILMGDAQEAALGQEIAAKTQSSVYSAIGKTSLTQMAALFKLCRLVVANDGGPLHVAVAVGAKTASLFGPVDDTVYGPWPREGHTVIKKGLACQPCYRRFRQAYCTHISCLQDLSVEDVYRKVAASL